MESLPRQDLVRHLKEVADSSIEELKSCPRQLLQDVQDNIHKATSKARSSLSTAFSTVHKAISEPDAACPPLGIGTSPSTASSTVHKTISEPDAPGGHSIRSAELVQRILNNLPQVLEFLKRDVEEILRDGLPQKNGDPRINDITRTTKLSTCDKLRSAFACVTLRQDNVLFNGGKKTKHTSMRMYAKSLGITDHHKLRDGVLQGNRIYFAACAYHANDKNTNPSANHDELELGIIAPLIFAS
jgi:hypothetical protein